jgi:cytochrome c biogenesis protein CcmG/thiol:disulfide interchange protein DsbE
MRTQAEGGTPVRATKQRGSLGLIFLLLAVFAGAFGVRLLHGQQSKPIDEDDDGAAQSALTAKVANLAPAQRLPALLKALQDSDPAVRTAAIDPLVSLHTPEAADAVESAFCDSASTVREAVLEGLPKMDRERGLRLDMAAFSDDDLWIRESVVSLLSSDPRHAFLDKRACPTLIHALEDPSPIVRTMSMTILRHMTGKNWRVVSSTTPEARLAVVQQWKQWWADTARSANVPEEFQTVAARPSTRMDPAPDFHLTDTTGKSVDLTSERGKVVLVNFWGTWCPPCKKETPDLIRLDADYHSKGLDVIGVALSEPNGVDGLRQRCTERGIVFRQATATDEILADYGHVNEVPVTVLIDAHGNIRNRWEGERDYATFRAAVDRIMRK